MSQIKFSNLEEETFVLLDDGKYLLKIIKNNHGGLDYELIHQNGKANNCIEDKTDDDLHGEYIDGKLEWFEVNKKDVIIDRPIRLNTIFRSILSFEKYIKSIAKENPEDMDLFDSINIEIWDKARKERKKPKDFVFTPEFWLFIKEHADIHFWINLNPFELSLMYFSHLLTNK